MTKGIFLAAAIVALLPVAAQAQQLEKKSTLRQELEEQIRRKEEANKSQHSPKEEANTSQNPPTIYLDMNRPSRSNNAPLIPTDYEKEKRLQAERDAESARRNQEAQQQHDANMRGQELAREFRLKDMEARATAFAKQYSAEGFAKWQVMHTNPYAFKGRTAVVPNIYFVRMVGPTTAVFSTTAMFGLVDTNQYLIVDGVPTAEFTTPNQFYALAVQFGDPANVGSDIMPRGNLRGLVRCNGACFDN